MIETGYKGFKMFEPMEYKINLEENRQSIESCLRKKPKLFRKSKHKKDRSLDEK